MLLDSCYLLHAACLALSAQHNQTWSTIKRGEGRDGQESELTTAKHVTSFQTR